jgi:hypothetical protein
VGLCILSLLGNNSIKTFPRQRRIGGVVFYAVRVVSKENRRLILPMFRYFDIHVMSSRSKVQTFEKQRHRETFEPTNAGMTSAGFYITRNLVIYTGCLMLLRFHNTRSLIMC